MVLDSIYRMDRTVFACPDDRQKRCHPLAWRFILSPWMMFFKPVSPVDPVRLSSPTAAYKAKHQCKRPRHPPRKGILREQEVQGFYNLSLKRIE